jgi:hypothetical protein
VNSSRMSKLPLRSSRTMARDELWEFRGQEDRSERRGTADVLLLAYLKLTPHRRPLAKRG